MQLKVIDRTSHLIGLAEGGPVVEKAAIMFMPGEGRTCRAKGELAGRRVSLPGEIGLSCPARHQLAVRPAAQSKATRFMNRCPASRAARRHVRETLPYLWMLCGCFFLAWMGQFAHLLRDTCDWRLVALVRAGLAFIFALGLARLTGARLVLWRPRALWLRGCASSLSLLCTFYAFTAMPTAEVVTLTNTFPIWVALMSWPLLNTRPGWQSCAAAGVGVLGVVLIQSPRMSLDQAALHAVAVSLVAALANAIAMLGLNRLKGVHPWAIVAHYSGIATLFALGACFVGGSSQLSLAADARTVLLLIAVGIAATAGQLCVTQAFTYGEPSRVSVVALFQVVFSLALDLSISGQTPPPVTLAGIALTVAPTTWVMMRGRMTRESPLLEQTSSAQVDRSGQCFEDLRAQRLGKLPHPCGLRSRCGCHS